ncbi:MarR family winged helix-turn-helix transcriptional regulator [Clavibacter sp. VKM Ac-2872]|uniref:MarR family winged helix-turn-helix transcriptional regulator n=1 Tax=Clavibacter sp. VKM Ac-2872 TaxID=2783812 RepID=UPI00188B77AC|nr:MarR family winged helix-turn-helix transcriptional regulator [Clavibacter sp. VKM Ac-2872]MBF4625765.1 winged helix-turn-helix transcriptional regulator [Clavibacter sp. VKM Ac-2872]
MRDDRTPGDDAPLAAPLRHDRIGFDDVDSARLAEVIASLADDINVALIPVWEPLTGLQVAFLNTIARSTAVTRSDLMRDTRTARASVVPGLASLLHQDFVVETPDGIGSMLTLGPAGRESLARAARARVAWVQRALEGPSGREIQDVGALAAALERLRGVDDLR